MWRDVGAVPSPDSGELHPFYEHHHTSSAHYGMWTIPEDIKDFRLDHAREAYANNIYSYELMT